LSARALALERWRGLLGGWAVLQVGIVCAKWRCLCCTASQPVPPPSPAEPGPASLARCRRRTGAALQPGRRPGGRALPGAGEAAVAGRRCACAASGHAAGALTQGPTAAGSWPPPSHNQPERQPRPHLASAPRPPPPIFLQVVGAQLMRLTSLSVVSRTVCGPDGRRVPASELLSGLPALSRLTRLTSLTVQAGSLQADGAPARDVLRALPLGAPLQKVGLLEGLGTRRVTEG
jgi:hypothetical protein